MLITAQSCPLSNSNSINQIGYLWVVINDLISGVLSLADLNGFPLPITNATRDVSCRWPSP